MIPNPNILSRRNSACKTGTEDFALKHIRELREIQDMAFDELRRLRTHEAKQIAYGIKNVCDRFIMYRR